MTSQKKKTKQTVKTGNNSQPSAPRGRRTPRSSPTTVPVATRETIATLPKTSGTRNVQTRSTNKDQHVELDDHDKARKENWTAAGEKSAATHPPPTTTATSDQANKHGNVANVKDNQTSPTTLMNKQSSETQFINQTSPQTKNDPPKQSKNEFRRHPLVESAMLVMHSWDTQ